ncbi:S-adenosyl-L-methionine-dependent tRNA 4-demethylwyosine synthase [uncultured archaeon]|nr:S-adenosyl-L-methionine-dependent tRNA 4-demethylwyosine synthase [uncultured archaeon]
MLNEDARRELEKQQYRVVGGHSAVKVCGWAKKMLRGEGCCYKMRFYGVVSSNCLQMSPSLSCANRCVFCWRGYKAPVAKEWGWSVDEPEAIVDGCLAAHHDLLVGFKGNSKVDRAAYDASKTVKHAALSLTGEPIIYPRINELINVLDERGISTFLVTNAQYPKQIRDLAPVTQLYLSVDAPTKELLKKVDVPLFPDYWERLNMSLEELSNKKQRTCIRLTLVKDMNMTEAEEYANLIKKADPDFVEAKGYMFVGASRQRLNLANMPTHEEALAFSQELLKHLPDYEIASDHPPSRAVLLAKKKFKKKDGWHTGIDFEKYHTLATSKKEFTTDDYTKKTPAQRIEQDTGEPE